MEDKAEEILFGGEIKIDHAVIVNQKKWKEEKNEDGEREIEYDYHDLIIHISVKASINLLTEINISRTITHRLTEKQIESFRKTPLVAVAKRKK